MDTSAEQITGTGSKQVRTRKRRSMQEKLQIVRETLQSGASVAVIARRHGVNANQVFTWRREYRRGELAAPAVENRRSGNPPTLWPVQIQEPPKAAAPERTVLSAPRSEDSQRMEIEFASGTRLRIWGSLAADRLQAILRELSGSC